jgi:hypothetical protein
VSQWREEKEEEQKLTFKSYFVMLLFFLFFPFHFDAAQQPSACIIRLNPKVSNVYFQQILITAPFLAKNGAIK